VEPAPVIVAEDIKVHYHGGPDAAVRDVSLTLHAGQGLLIGGGPLSGKTSVLRAVLGLVPARGHIRVFGAPPGPPAARPVGYGPEGRDFADRLTLREVVHAVASMRGLADVTAAREDALDRAGLSFVADYRTRRLDEEGFRRLSLAVAVVGDPDLVVLDDPWVIPETLDEIRAARARGAAVLVAARNPGGLAPALGGRIVLIDGRPR
jgi:ABC-type multidrug transport system ATPase subunit